MNVSLFVNEKPYTWDVRPDETLDKSLRKHGFVGVKTGCGQGACGMCTVWVDGKPVPSCTQLTARLAGRRITTVEGVQKEAQALGRYLVAEGVDQCGFCAPGFIMLALAMPKELSAGAPAEEIERYFAGNLCRCTGYRGKTRAVLQYLRDRGIRA